MFYSSFYTPRFNEVERGYNSFTSSGRLSVRLSVRPSVDGTVSALYIAQYKLDLFNVYNLINQLKKCVAFFVLFLKNSKIWRFSNILKFLTLAL